MSECEKWRDGEKEGKTETEMKKKWQEQDIKARPEKGNKFPAEVSEGA